MKKWDRMLVPRSRDAGGNVLDVDHRPDKRAQALTTCLQGHPRHAGQRSVVSIHW